MRESFSSGYGSQCLASANYVIGHAGSSLIASIVHLGKLTLTNYALYFEASGAVTYEQALKLNLSKNTEQSVKPAATGPFGAPLFDKAIIYKSSEL